MRILAIDIGSSSVKVGLWDRGVLVTRAREVFRTRLEGIQVEAPAEAVWRALVRAARKVAADSVDVVAFCVFSSAVVVTGERGDVRVGAITHQDRRSVAEAAALCAKLGKKWLLERTGNLPYPGGIGSSTLAWLRRHEGAAFGRGYRVGQLSSFVGRRMTGEWVTDPSQAVFLGLWDIEKKLWNERVCEAVGVDVGSLPRVVWADEVQGRLTRAAARMLELNTGAPVVGGLVDGSAGVLLTPMEAGQLVHHSGSTDVLAMCAEGAAGAEGILSRPVGVGKVFPARWLAVRTTAAAGSALDRARRNWFRELGDKAWERRVTDACQRAQATPGVRCAATFAGQRAAIEQESGAAFSGLTLATNREEMLAAIVRGLVEQSAESYGKLAAIRPPGRRVFAMGGARTLQQAMQRAWPGRHDFVGVEGDGLRGLAELGERAMHGGGAQTGRR